MKKPHPVSKSDTHESIWKWSSLPKWIAYSWLKSPSSPLETQPWKVKGISNNFSQWRHGASPNLLGKAPMCICRSFLAPKRLKDQAHTCPSCERQGSQGRWTGNPGRKDTGRRLKQVCRAPRSWGGVKTNEALNIQVEIKSIIPKVCSRGKKLDSFFFKNL